MIQLNDLVRIALPGSGLDGMDGFVAGLDWPYPDRDGETGILVDVPGVGWTVAGEPNLTVVLPAGSAGCCRR